MTTNYPPTLGLVLAGGLARRMGGGDKARIEIGGVSILDRVLATLSAQCTGIIINANGDPRRFADTGLTVVADTVPDFAGPLAGILAGLDWLAKQKNGIEWIVSVPGDCPFLPDDLVERLHQARRKMGAGVPLACARSGEWRHPVVGLWPLALREDLRKALVEEASAQDRGLDRAAWCRHRRLARSAGRSLLQRQHAGRCGPRRAHCVAAYLKDLHGIFDHCVTRSISAIVGSWVLGEEQVIMKSFIVACVVAVVIAVIGGVVLSSVPDSAEQCLQQCELRPPRSLAPDSADQLISAA